MKIVGDCVDQHKQGMRADWLAWHATISAIPEDAGGSLGYSTKDMPQR